MGRRAQAFGRWLGRVARLSSSLVLACVLTVLVFLVLPLMQHVSRPPASDLEFRSVGTANLPPPPPPPPQEEPEEEEQEEPPPELAEEAPPLDLDQLELALNPGFGEGLGGDFAVRLFTTGEKSEEEADAIFSMAELDQLPRVVYQPPPDYPAELRRKKIDGTVYVLFVVDQSGRVNNPVVQESTHQAFDRPALRAVKRWRFEPGKRNGAPVRFKMRVPITFMSS
jgi:protein TonB